MSYSGNMPDWHQYNPPQHGRATTTSGGQNVNSGSHLFLPSINPPTLDTINLTTNDRQGKHQRNDVNYTGRNYPQPGAMANSSTSGGVHLAPLSSCVNHYGTSPSRNPMIDSITPGTMDPRLGDTELPHRSNQMSFNTSTNHTNTNTMTSIHGGITSQTSPVGPMSPSRQVPPYVGPCKGPCCHPDPNIAYQHWEKYGHYQTNAAYRSSYPIDNRRYVPPDMNLRKECLENKELGLATFGVDNRRNYSDYKYRKEMSRNYSSGLLQNYPMQHFNYPTDCQKCPHAVKDYMRRTTNGTSMSTQNSGIIKYPEQQSVIVQQKYNGKQLSYQNGVLSTALPTTNSTNLSSSLQNSYFNHQISRDFSREYPDPNVVNNSSRVPTSPSTGVQGSYQKYHVYQQKIAMQRYSVENHLRAMTRIPGYQSHPKYQEYMVRYRELMRLQQNVDYQGVLQDTPKISSPTNTAIAPINLQFDQHGVLINSNYGPGHYSGMHNPLPANQNPESIDNLGVSQSNPPIGSIESLNQFVKHADHTLNLSRDMGHIHHTNDGNHERYLMQKNNNNNPTEQFENLIVDVDELDGSRAITTATGTISTTTTTTTASMSEGEKIFADKPQLDVRQFLANWDETEEEEAAVAASQLRTISNNSTSVIVADCSSKKEVNQEKNIQLPRQKSPEKDKSAEKMTTIESSNIVQENVENIDVTGLTTIEELANSRTIVQCIQSGNDDIPTIHIVDNMPEVSELTTIQTVYGDVASLTMEDIAKAPIEIINETSEGTETITLFEADSGVCTKMPECDDEDIDVDGTIVVQEVVASVINPTVQVTPAPEATSDIVNQTIEKPISNENVAQGLDLSNKSQQSNGENSNLPSQHNFVNEESHNPDDISLPDIPMSECTPISTTLNTPIHSDSEESSGEHGTALEISTNPIEIVKNSPIISFTHSPIKIDPYDNSENGRMSEKRPHDSLDFDFDQDQKKFTETNKNTMVSFEMRRSSTESIKDTSQAQTEKQSSMTNRMDKKSCDNDEEFYPSSDPLVGMGQTPSRNNNQKNSPVIPDMSNDIIESRECCESLEANERPGTPVSRIMSPDEINTGRCPSIIDTEDFEPSDDLDKFCNISLDDSCMMPLMAGVGDSTLPDVSIEDHSLEKAIKNVGPISELDVLETSDDEQLDQDAWVEVRSLDGELAADLSVNKSTNRCQEYTSKSPHSNELVNNLHSTENDNKITKHHKTATNWSDYTKVKHNPKSDNYYTNCKSSDERVHETKTNYIPSIFDISGDSQSTDIDQFERKKQQRHNKDQLKSLREYRRDKSKDRSKPFENDNVQGQCQDLQDSNSRFSSDTSSFVHVNSSEAKEKGNDNIQGRIIIKNRADELQQLDDKSSTNKSDVRSENREICTVTKSFRSANKDTDVQIHVANINVNEKSDDTDTNDAVGAIEIKINVSRSEKNRREFAQDKLIEEFIRKRAFITSELNTVSPGRIFNQRRLSVPEELETTRPKKISESTRRRNSGGHSYKSYHRQLFEERSDTDDKSHFDSVSRNSQLPTIFERDNVERDNVNQSNLNERTVSSRDTSQYSNDERQEGTNIKESLYSNLNEFPHIASRSSYDMTPGPSHEILDESLWNKSNFLMDNMSMLDFDNFDVAPNDKADTDGLAPSDDVDIFSRIDEQVRSRRFEDSEKYRNPYATSKPFGVEAVERNLNTVPIYTTKDGKITYSPNPRYTYRALIMEARQREGYPAPRQSYHSKSSRESQERRLYNKYRNDSFEKRRWSEHNSKKINQLFRRRMDDSRRNRTFNKYDNRRRDNLSETEEFTTDDRSRIYSDTSVPPSYYSTDSAFKSQHHKYYQAIQSSRRDKYRQEDLMQRRKSGAHLEGERVTENLTSESLSSHSYGQYSQVLDSTKCESRLFNGQEMELFTKTVEAESRVEFTEHVSQSEERCLAKQNFTAIINEKELSKTQIGWTVPNRLIPVSDDESKDITRNSMKPPVSVETEQDSQAMLTDSGLESSTTYTEGCKEPKRCQKWNNTYVNNSDKLPTIDSNVKKAPIIVGSEHIANKNDIIFVKPPVNSQLQLNQPNIEPMDTDLNHDRLDELAKIEETLTEKENAKSTKDIVKLTQLFLATKQETGINLDSSTLKGLDLAFPSRRIATRESGIPKIVEPEIEQPKNQDEKLKPTWIFDRPGPAFLKISRPAETPSRRASTDAVDSMRKQSIFYEDISSATALSAVHTKTIFINKNIELDETKDTNTKIIEETQSSVSRIDRRAKTREDEYSQSDDELFERPQDPPALIYFGPFNKPDEKSNEMETSEMSAESGVSHYDDTLSSTQFGSECADSKTGESSSMGVTYLSTSSQEAIDATDLNQVRKNLALCAIDDITVTKEPIPIEPTQNDEPLSENAEKILSFSGRITSESEDDSNAQDASPIQHDETQDLSVRTDKDKNKILNFSGQIPSPENPTENFSKQIEGAVGISSTFSDKYQDEKLTFSGKIKKESPCSSSPATDKIPKFIIKKTDGDSKSSSISQIFLSDVGSQKSNETKGSLIHKISLHPKIPKMIIRNVKSRPVTPTLEESAVELEFPKASEGESKVFQVKLKLDDKTAKNNAESSVKKSIGIIECKIPKMKIKLEDRVPKMVFENASMELFDSSDSSKNVPKLKIRKIKSSNKMPKKSESSEKGERSKTERQRESSKKSSESSHRSENHDDNNEKLKIKIKKHDMRSSSPSLSPERWKNKRSKSPSDHAHKNPKKSSNRHRNLDTRELIDNESNTSSHQSASEKIPKVIIKRASASAEFKCELSKDGGDAIIHNSKWQPEVKLERFKVLDSIAKDLGRTKLPPRMLDMITKERERIGTFKCLRRTPSSRAVSDPVDKSDKYDRSLSAGKRRYSDPERSKSSTKTDEKIIAKKSSSMRSLNDDSDSEVFPKLIRRNVSRRLPDESSVDTQTTSAFKSDKRKLIVSDTSSMSLQEPQTTSEFEYPSVSSSQKKINSPTNKLISPVIDNTDISIVDVKSHNPANLDEAETVIKLESSDESQTTIEILPASPDLSQPESEVPIPLEGKRRIANGDMAQLYSEDAIPTQFELELEIVDNSSEFSQVQLPCEETHSENCMTNSKIINDSACSTLNIIPGPSFCRTREDDREIMSLCCSDLLVKEVLAAKETLKRCLAKTKNESAKTNLNLRPKTAAEKKQGAGYDSVQGENLKKDQVFQSSSANSSEILRKEHSRTGQTEKRQKSERNSNFTDRRDKRKSMSGMRKSEETSSICDPRTILKRPREPSLSRDQSNLLKKIKPPSVFSSTSLCTESSRNKASPSFGTKCESTANSRDSERSHYKIPKISRSQGSQDIPKLVKAMPILEPVGRTHFEPTERETSRSPPVITKQDSNEISPESPGKVEKKDGKKIETADNSLTFAEIVAQMAYHEKATIRHRRYCILCERWFPTTSRHRRHLIGYQHRHTELTQRRTVHALFMLFTGKPCPRLLPASIIRTDCVPGEPTPLQIAVQDVAISLEKGDTTKTLNEENM